MICISTSFYPVFSYLPRAGPSPFGYSPKSWIADRPLTAYNLTLIISIMLFSSSIFSIASSKTRCNLSSDRVVLLIQRDSVHDVVAAAGRGPVPDVLRHLAVHGARGAELRADDRGCVQCCCKYTISKKR